MTIIPPSTHPPHSITVFMPGPFEARIPIVTGVCDEGRCLKDKPDWPLSPRCNAFAHIPIIERYRAAGLDAHDLPGIHWWDETPTYRWCQEAIALKLAQHEGRTEAARSIQQRMFDLRKDLR